jgi:hypothetical protein
MVRPMARGRTRSAITGFPKIVTACFISLSCAAFSASSAGGCLGRVLRGNSA